MTHNRIRGYGSCVCDTTSKPLTRIWISLQEVMSKHGFEMIRDFKICFQTFLTTSTCHTLHLSIALRKCPLVLGFISCMCIISSKIEPMSEWFRVADPLNHTCLTGQRYDTIGSNVKLTLSRSRFTIEHGVYHFKGLLHDGITLEIVQFDELFVQISVGSDCNENFRTMNSSGCDTNTILKSNHVRYLRVVQIFSNLQWCCENLCTLRTVERFLCISPSFVKILC